MISTLPKFLSRRAALPLVLLGLLVASAWSAHAQEQSAWALIRFLTDGPDGLAGDAARIGVFSCGQVTADRAAAKLLVKLGDSAIPDVEKELGAIEARGGRLGDGAPWLELVYARLKGPASYPTLKRMESAPSPGLPRANFDSSIALSLDLTSYVSSSRLLARAFHCTRGSEPRDALDQLILAWEKNDRAWLDASLGPKASAALTALLDVQSWAAMRSELWHVTTNDVAVGYRFETAGWWAEAAETLDDRKDKVYGPLPENPRFKTRFTNGAGKTCGEHQIDFLDTEVDTGPGHLRYLSDTSDIISLLRLITACAAPD